MVTEVSKPEMRDSVLSFDCDQLWSQIREGEEKALSKLFCKYYEQLFNYGYNMVSNEAFIRDCIQELFLMLWEYRETIKEARSVKSYLLCSMRRMVFKKLDKQKARYKRNRTYIKSFFEDTLNAEELMVHFETKYEHKQQLIDAIDKLSKRQKEAIYLKFYDGFSNREIAHVMGINRQSVYNHVSEAIQQLQQFIR